MAENPVLQQISDVYYALRASGVQRLPKPSPREQGEGAIVDDSCLFLIDFSTVGEGQAADFVPPILRRLLERLPWGKSVTVFSAFDSLPRSPQLNPIHESLKNRCRDLFAQGQFKRVVCFGWRAGAMLSAALGQVGRLPSEAYESVSFSSEEFGTIAVIILPDVRELEAIPEWRARVWESLLAFAPR